MKKHIERLDNISWDLNAKVWYSRIISKKETIITHKKLPW